MVKLAKKGMTPSAIGVILRDQHGISQVRTTRRVLSHMFTDPALLRTLQLCMSTLVARSHEVLSPWKTRSHEVLSRAKHVVAKSSIY
jgi:Ribosomal S13/S15 N-terminal domain